MIGQGSTETVAWRAACGCALLEVGDGPGSSHRREFCGLGARIDGMMRFALEHVAAVGPHEEYLRWDALYHQRADLLDAHTGHRHEIGVIEQA